jgi:hypothetical protein
VTRYEIDIERINRFAWDWTVWDADKNPLNGMVDEGWALSERAAKRRAERAVRNHAQKQRFKQSYSYEVKA